MPIGLFSPFLKNFLSDSVVVPWENFTFDNYKNSQSSWGSDLEHVYTTLAQSNEAFLFTKLIHRQIIITNITPKVIKIKFRMLLNEKIH